MASRERGFTPFQPDFRPRGEIDELSAYRLRADASKEFWNLSAGGVCIFDIAPTEPNQDPPIMLVEGFGVMNPRYRNMLEISNAGNRAIGLYPSSRYGGVVAPFRDHFAEDIRRARLIIETAERKNLKGVDLIAKSGGAAGSLVAAIARPDLISNIALLNPNGMVEDRPRGLMGRFIRKAVGTKNEMFNGAHPAVDVSPLYAGFELFATLFSNPKRTIDEISALGNTDLHGLMRRSRENGTLVSVIAAIDDQLFPLAKIFEKMRQLQNDGIGHRPFEGFYVVKGGHDEVGSASRIQLGLNALRNMRALRNDRFFWGNNS